MFDDVFFGDKSLTLREFLTASLLTPTGKAVVEFDAARGTHANANGAGIDGDTTERFTFAFAERELRTNSKVGLIVSYAGAVFPAGEMNTLGPDDRANVIRAHGLAMDSTIAKADKIVFIISETLSELNALLVNNPRVAAVEIPLPDRAVRLQAVRAVASSLSDADADRLADHTAGLRAIQVMRILKPRPDEGMQANERRAFILKLLGASTNAAERADRFAQMTVGMDENAIRALVNPDAADADKTHSDPLAEVLELIHKRKREIIEKECAGLVEFVESRHGLEAVGGNAGIKAELSRIAALVRAGDKRRAPMGVLCVGAMGTGKTFVVKCFLKTAGLPGIILKDFRDKWVG
ncbi:MAG: ATP-binding protein, partial [Pseudomonadota bacterium]|nr:ATP-binding protein [Pseudomonadota bacterium]